MPEFDQALIGRKNVGVDADVLPLIGKLIGDSIINIRKGKLIATYELAVSVSFVGHVGDSDQVTGTILLPYISEVLYSHPRL
jgi:activator of HSP90 ATPase